jgi:hypothetical protein
VASDTPGKITPFLECYLWVLVCWS